MTKDIPNARLSKVLATPLPLAVPSLPSALEDLRVSVDRFCLLAGVEALGEMLAEDAEALCGPRHARSPERRGYRWGTTASAVAYQGGKVKVSRPRVRDLAGTEMSLPSWQALSDPDLLRAWATNLMVLNVSTRKYRRAVRLPEGDLPVAKGDATSKSAVSRRFVALTRRKLKAWLASDLSALDLLVIQIDGLHVGDHVLVAAVGVDGRGDKHVLGIAEGATENAATVQALLDNLIARGLDPSLPRLFIVDGAKALSKAIRNTFGIAAAIQRCQVHKGRNITERLDEHLHAGVKKTLRQAWDQDDADKAERLLKNLARRLEHEQPGVSASILEGLDEILTVIRLGLPRELRRSLACTNAIENALGTVRTVSRNVKRWRNAEMALRWTAAGLIEAQKTFRRLKAYRHLPILRKALEDHMQKAKAKSALDTIKEAA
jgi:transposase-like protein